MFIEVRKDNLKVDKQKLAKILNINSEDIYLEDQDFGLYPIKFYVDELPERTDSIAHSLASRIDFGNRNRQEIYDLITKAIVRIPNSIKIDIINKAISIGIDESSIFSDFEDSITDNIDDKLYEFLLDHQEYIFPDN